MRNGDPLTIEANALSANEDLPYNVVFAKPGDTIQVVTAKKPSLGLFVSVIKADGTVVNTEQNAPYTITDSDVVIAARWSVS